MNSKVHGFLFFTSTKGSRVLLCVIISKIGRKYRWVTSHNRKFSIRVLWGTNMLLQQRNKMYYSLRLEDSSIWLGGPALNHTENALLPEYPCFWRAWIFFIPVFQVVQISWIRDVCLRSCIILLCLPLISELLFWSALTSNSIPPWKWSVAVVNT